MVEIKQQTEILTNREFEILKLLTKGCTTREVAPLLNISPETVTTHRKNLLKKFNAKNCTELIYKVMKLDII